VFLLSVCLWIQNWQEVIRFAARASDRMLFESNGPTVDQAAQFGFLHSVYREVDMLAGQSSDDPGQKNRRLFLCSIPTG
jgi:hypothetical protein